MNESKKEMLQYGYEYCNDKDKSTEFMIEFMQDVASASLDEVLEFLKTKSEIKWNPKKSKKK